MRRVTFAAAVGNTVETYDYAAYGFLTVLIAELFFPGSQPGVALLSAFAAFGVAFVVRPLGSLLFGSIADRFGRKPSLVATLVLMAGATTLIGLLPTAASIGVWAPALLVVCRLIQGLAAGGEYGTAMTYAAEFTPRRKRGAMTSRVQIGSVVSLLLAAGVVLLLSASLSPQAMASWGWRIPFLLALPLGLVGLYIRARLEESPEFRALERQGRIPSSPAKESFTKHWSLIALVFGVAALQQIGYYIAFTYAQSYIIQLGFTPAQATLATVISIAVAVVLVAVGGPLSDRWGRWPMLFGLSAAMLVLAYPLLAALSSATSLGTVILTTVLLGVVPALYTSVAPATYIEIVPARVRATVFAVGFALAAALLGGPALYVSQSLVRMTGDNRSPALFLMFGALLSLAAAVVVRRRHPEVLTPDLPAHVADVPGARSTEGV
ncbi:MFS transporter [Streptomyces luomodiensis]|uniref:MFS transporter n=2 Tax=Streptomyces TaxID=1883 RepID=A0ABY9VBP0_9ACTN|nr:MULTISPECIES: MFS transporter [unclassified Streptomyces]WAP60408.1 MFS transporter [Streptomyces sp. S465]WNF01059.1 MFS transporter [Streptomyces sp. SCA4-21]